jgi:hypothetical protein
MPFTIPNESAAAFPAQARLFSSDVAQLIAAYGRTGVRSGCGVTAQGTPDMTVAVGAGSIEVAGALVSVSSGNVTITAADATNPRIDLIVADSAGTKSAVAGTPAADPTMPALPANSVALAAVYVPANDTAINSNQITDKRIDIWDADRVYHAGDYGTYGTEAAIQAAIDAASAGSTVYIGSGTWPISTGLTITKNIHLRGAGSGGTFLSPSADVDAVGVNVAGGSQISNVILSDFSIFPSTARTAGAALRIGYVGFSFFRNLRIGNNLGGAPFEGIRVDRGSDLFFTNVITQGCASHGCVLQPGSSSSVIVEIWFDYLCQFRTGDADGLRLVMDQVYSEGVCSLEGIHFFGQVYNNALSGVRGLATVAGASPRNLHFGGTYDSNDGASNTAGSVDAGLVLEATDASAEFRRVLIDLGAGWSSNNANAGIYLQRVKDFTITGGQVRSNLKHGIDLQNCTKGYVDSTIVDNSRGADNTSYGLQIGGASTDITVASQFDNTDASANDQRGINLGSTATTIDWGKARFRNQDTGTVPIVNGGNAAGNTGLRTFPLGAGSVVAKTSAYTVENDVETVKADTSGGAFTVTLPRAANFPGRIIAVKRTAGTAAVTIAATAGTVEAATVTTTPIAHQSDGTNWIAVALPDAADPFLSAAKWGLG